MQRCRDIKIENKKGYHNLLIWQKPKDLVILIYKTTQKFPETELYGLTSQIRRAVVSVLLNIIEGDRRKSQKEFLRFLELADASLTEVEACLELALELEFLSQEDYTVINEKRKELAVMLSAFTKSIKRRV